MTDFGMFCILCGKRVTGDPIKHIVGEHQPLQYFTLVPQVSWEKLGVSLPPPQPKKEEDEIKQ